MKFKRSKKPQRDSAKSSSNKSKDLNSSTSSTSSKNDLDSFKSVPLNIHQPHTFSHSHPFVPGLA